MRAQPVLGELVAPGVPLAERVHAQLRADILMARLRPGEALSENQLALRLGVSRTPVREAIQRLVREGLVQVWPQRGSLVSLMSLQRIREALFVREAVECQVMRRLLSQDGPAHRWDGLAACLKQQARALRDEDVQATLQADADFHRGLLELCGMEGVWPVVAQARDLHQRIRAIAVPELRSGRRAVSDHQAILEALKAGDVERAVRACADHVRHNEALAREVARLHPDYFAGETDADQRL